ncbi:MAG: chaperone modulator CbpM [Pseudomonadales bacterium]|nr:chaperone modulator CbpM [Pseudomonadales bacterium]
MEKKSFNGVLLDEHMLLNLSEFSRAGAHHTEWIVELVAEGILEPEGNAPDDWLFSTEGLSRAQKAMRLQQDLHINMAGIALALQLMDQLANLQAQLRQN